MIVVRLFCDIVPVTQLIKCNTNQSATSVSLTNCVSNLQAAEGFLSDVLQPYSQFTRQMLQTGRFSSFQPLSPGQQWMSLSSLTRNTTDGFNVITRAYNIFSHINEYFDAESLDRCSPITQSVNLQLILHLNIRNLITNFDIFYANPKCLKHSFSIIVLTEAATNAETENWVDIPWYTKLMKSRVGMKGGGLAIFFNNDLHIAWRDQSYLSLKDSREMESL